MNMNHQWKFGSPLAIVPVLASAVLLLVACQPIVAPTPSGSQAVASPTPVVSETAVPSSAMTMSETSGITATVPSAVGPAMATISARSLRVRQAPDDTSEVVAGVKEGEKYKVLGISSDGLWVQLEIPKAPAGKGWVSADFVTLEGDITNVTKIQVPAMTSTEVATATQAVATTEVATATQTVMATEVMTPTAAMTPEPVATQTPTATEAMTSTEVMTATATVSATQTSGQQPSATPGPGFALVQTDGTPLRVRSAPTTAEDNKIGNVFNGEIYRVLEVSQDGKWVRIDVPQLGVKDGGWVSSEFVVIGK